MFIDIQINNPLNCHIKRNLEGIVSEARRFCMNDSRGVDLAVNIQLFFLHANPLYQGLVDLQHDIDYSNQLDCELSDLAGKRAEALESLKKIEPLRRRYQEGQPCYNAWWKSRVLGVMSALAEINPDF
ncbi:hypothetical protein W97_04760 [Coniosporium apollinis CBS 100218]|uniref:Uncharacterized protein n=1 Tax=Coniosporium apollinis (strain CBS 100218) TaxID=1168221 RepID=R7YUE1_CONA1|nr:uncharacterized protein W97_04760 [Coniosporium apollinis CBS 100218]EON65522.1 hypothetical protein W97_04760 [Coniosporium apollinis CBS 100218]